MKTYADQKHKDSVTAAANSLTKGSLAIQLKDNRPGALAQRNLQAGVNNSTPIQAKSKININDNAALEQEADVMGAKVLQQVDNRSEIIQGKMSGSHFANTDVSMPIQRKPADWKVNPDIAAIKSIPSSRWRSTAWQPIKEKIAIYEDLAAVNTQKRKEVLGAIQELIKTWIKDHPDSDKDDRIRVIYYSINKLLKFTFDEIEEMNRVEEPPRLKKEEEKRPEEEVKEADYRGDALAGDGPTFRNGDGELLRIYREGDAFKGSYRGKKIKTEKSHLNFSAANSIATLIYLEATPTLKGIGTALLAEAASVLLAEGCKKCTLAETNANSIHLANILIGSGVLPLPRTKGEKSDGGGVKGDNERLTVSSMVKAATENKEGAIESIYNTSKTLQTDILQERYFDLAKVKNVFYPKFQNKWKKHG